MPALRIATNQPERVRLLSLEAETAASNFGQDQLRFRTDRGDLYVSVAVGTIFVEAIAQQGIKAGEPVEISKREVAVGSRKTIRWELTRVAPAVGAQPTGTFAVPAAPRGPVSAPIARPVTQPAPAGWTGVLLAQTNALADVYAAALAHSSAIHGNAVKPDDIRSLLVTAYINLAKGISHAA